MQSAGSLESSLGLCRHQYAQCARDVGGNRNHPWATAVGYYTDLLGRGLLTLDGDGNLISPIEGIVFGVGARLVGVDTYEISISFGAEVPPEQLRAGLDMFLAAGGLIAGGFCTAGTAGACGPAAGFAAASLASSVQSMISSCGSGDGSCGLNVALAVVDAAATVTPAVAAKRLQTLVKAGAISADTAADLSIFIAMMADSSGALNDAFGIGSSWVSGASAAEVSVNSRVRNVR